MCAFLELYGNKRYVALSLSIKILVGRRTNIVAAFLLCLPEVLGCKQEYCTCCSVEQGYNVPSAAISGVLFISDFPNTVISMIGTSGDLAPHRAPELCCKSCNSYVWRVCMTHRCLQINLWCWHQSQIPVLTIVISRRNVLLMFYALWWNMFL